mgnify:FL=1
MSKLETNQVDPASGTTLTLGTSGDTVTVPTGVGLTATDEVKSNKLSPATGTALQIGDSGDTITIPSGATITNNGTQSGFGGVNTPCFRAKISNGTSLSDGAATKVEFGTEVFDVGGCYNNTSGTVTLNGISVPSYSFLPNVAGKYFIAAAIRMNGDTDFDIFDCQFGGVDNNRFAVVQRRYNSASCSTIVEFNGTSDAIHVEGFQVSGGTQTLYNSGRDTWFYGYKIIE